MSSDYGLFKQANADITVDSHLFPYITIYFSPSEVVLSPDGGGRICKLLDKLSVADIDDMILQLNHIKSHGLLNEYGDDPDYVFVGFPQEMRHNDDVWWASGYPSIRNKTCDLCNTEFPVEDREWMRYKSRDICGLCRHNLSFDHVCK